MGLDNKYYIPTIEEFHVGFEFEYKDFNGYKKDTVSFIDEQFILDVEFKRVRVKCLDKEDIESLGWGFVKDIYMRTMQSGLVYYLWITPNVVSINVSSGGGLESSNQIFRGTIKNKSEFKKLMKQLRINE